MDWSSESALSIAVEQQPEENKDGVDSEGDDRDRRPSVWRRGQRDRGDGTEGEAVSVVVDQAVHRGVASVAAEHEAEGAGKMGGVDGEREAVRRRTARRFGRRYFDDIALCIALCVAPILTVDSVAAKTLQKQGHCPAVSRRDFDANPGGKRQVKSRSAGPHRKEQRRRTRQRPSARNRGEIQRARPPPEAGPAGHEGDGGGHQRQNSRDPYPQRAGHCSSDIARAAAESQPFLGEETKHRRTVSVKGRDRSDEAQRATATTVDDECGNRSVIRFTIFLHLIGALKFFPTFGRDLLWQIDGMSS